MNPKILVVDDSRMVRSQVTLALVDAGFEVVEACDGRDALQKLDDGGVSLVVCDINMPNMDGIEFLDRLRTKPFRAPPVVMLTTEGQPDLVQRAKTLGAKGWIMKPFKPALLIAAAKRLIAAA